MASPAATKASTGAMNAGTMTFDSRPSPLMALVPAATKVAPTAPPKFRIAAKPTARRGDMARVEIDVATTLAVSWNPLVKSKASAVTTTMPRIRSLSIAAARSRVLDDDALEDVGHLLGGVDRRLQALEEVLPADHDHRVDAVVEEGSHRLAAHPVAVVLQPVDLDGVVRDVAEAAHPRHRVGDLARGLQQDVREPLPLDHRSLDLVEAHVVGDLLGVVDDVVERRGQLVDVLAVDRGDEGLVEALDDVVGDPVALLLADQDVPRQVGALRVVAEHLVQEVGRAHDVARRLLEQVEELAVVGNEDLGQAAHV